MKLLSESVIVGALAEEVGLRITRKVIPTLQALTVTLSGDDSGLETVWDEICAQVQTDESVFWNIYDKTVQDIVLGCIRDLTDYERAAVWLQTNAGENWTYEDEADRLGYPVNEGDIAKYIAHRHIYGEAAEYSNPRIYAYVYAYQVRSHRADMDTDD
jgi:DNA-directed RNA polymerase specialized sigma24 family protein